MKANVSFFDWSICDKPGRILKTELDTINFWQARLQALWLVKIERPIIALDKRSVN